MPLTPPSTPPAQAKEPAFIWSRPDQIEPQDDAAPSTPKKKATTKKKTAKKKATTKKKTAKKKATKKKKTAKKKATKKKTAGRAKKRR
jgi:hypothetical protein